MGAMEHVVAIPVLLEGAEVAERLRFDPGREGFESLNDLVRLAQDLIDPRGAWEVAFVGAGEDGKVEVGSVVFLSAVLRKNLENANKVFPYVITIGPELERVAAEQDDLLKQFYLEEIANLALEQAAAWLSGHLESRYGVAGLANLSPGSLADWPITEQPKLFKLVGDPERLVGVRLNESLLMIPRKSVSGLLFPSEEGFVACQLCDREHCQGRKAPYAPSP